MGGSEFVAGLVSGAIGGLVSGGVTWFVTRRIMLHQLREERSDRRGEAVRAAWQPFDQACRLAAQGHGIDKSHAAALDSLLAGLRVAGASPAVCTLATDVRSRLSALTSMPRGIGSPLVVGRTPEAEPASVLEARRAYATAVREFAERLAELERAVGEETREG